MSSKHNYIILYDSEQQKFRTSTEIMNYFKGNGIEWDSSSYLAWKTKDLEKPDSKLYCLGILLDTIYTKPALKVRVMTREYGYPGTDIPDQYVSETFNLRPNSVLISRYYGKKIR